MAPKKDTAASKKANESAPAEAPAAPATTTTKKSASTHPSYKDMIKEAILQLKERNGSSRQALKKYIQSNFEVNASNFDYVFNNTIKKGVASGDFVQPKGPSGTVKLNKKEPAEKKTVKKAAVKKAATDSKKTAAKKETPAKKAAPKKKAVAKKDDTKEAKEPVEKKAPAKKAAPKKKAEPKKAAAPKKADAKVTKKPTTSRRSARATVA
ncbi:hypothetical protein DV451_002842 [Geotrichum candidum]|uniref:Histone H1 n=1 Tax=Geotrichum candidum TaxID=1173061 RepID=A0A0J9X6W2_GEOCN|nr:hypothetical protein DV451_002842 [Geotrichum candidum]KAF5109281.1 hypothetical protein DV453_001705 [Geotrichum candidum]KAF5109832.1 hypothetical protein DV452_004627 [Geotrichum candidum]KAF5114764.1 hypothetical protein DV454_002710 [Geotrichum candidum]KAF5122843.1 hypothetical protein DV495_004154 [Geotrichum candidum]